MAKNQPIIRNNTYLTNTICRVLMPSSLIHAFKEAAERCGAIEHHLIGGRGTPSMLYVISGTEADIVALKLSVSPEVQFINYNKTARRFG